MPALSMIAATILTTTSAEKNSENQAMSININYDPYRARLKVLDEARHREVLSSDLKGV
jgi:hypothetical protein